MCNEYERFIEGHDVPQMMEGVEAAGGSWRDVDWPPPAASVRIGDTSPAIRAAGNGVEFAQMKFGLPPARPGRGPVFNFRSDGRSFANSNRCVIPASGFFEFVGTSYPKVRYRFALRDSPILGIAGIWRSAPDGSDPAFTMLTCEPGRDVAPIHDRQVVVLPPRDWLAWIFLTRPEAELLQPSPAGALSVEVAPRAAEPKQSRQPDLL